jgi:peptidyl-prolyl cis-trans isomerase SurA
VDTAIFMPVPAIFRDYGPSKPKMIGMKRRQSQPAEITRSMATRSSQRRNIALSLTVAASLGVSSCHKPAAPDVVALVDGQAITRSELDQYYTARQKQMGSMRLETPEQGDMDRWALLGDLIDRKIIELQAVKMKVTVKDEDVDIKFAEIKARYTEAQFNQLLQQSNQTISDLRRNLRSSLTADRLINREINSKISVTDQDTVAYFNAYRADFNLAENKYRIAQIVGNSVPTYGRAALFGSKANSAPEARAKIQILKSRIDNGEDFNTLASSLSDAPSAANGGDMGFLLEHQLRSNTLLFAAVSTLKVGETSEILELSPTDSSTPPGYMIVKLISRKGIGQRDLTSPVVQQNVRNQIRNDRSQLLETAYLEILRDNAKVENFFAEEFFAKNHR